MPYIATTQQQIDNLFAVLGLTSVKDQPSLDPWTTPLTVSNLRIQPERECKLRHYNDQTLAGSGGLSDFITGAAVAAGGLASQTSVAALVSSDADTAGLITLAAVREVALPTRSVFGGLTASISELRHEMNLSFDEALTRLSHGGYFIVRPTNSDTGYDMLDWNTAPRPEGVPAWAGLLENVMTVGHDGLADHTLDPTNKSTAGKTPYLTVANQTLAEFHGARSLNLPVGGAPRPSASLSVSKPMEVDRNDMPASISDNVTVSNVKLGPSGFYADYTNEYINGTSTELVPASLLVQESSSAFVDTGNIRLYFNNGSEYFNLDEFAFTHLRDVMSNAQVMDAVNSEIGSNDLTLSFSTVVAEALSTFPQAQGITMTQGVPGPLFSMFGELNTNIPEMKNIDNDLLYYLIGTADARKTTTIDITATAPQRMTNPDLTANALDISDVSLSWTPVGAETSRDLAIVTSTPGEDAPDEGFRTVSFPVTNANTVTWAIDVAALQAAPAVNQTTGDVGDWSLRNYNATYALDIISTEGSSALFNGTNNVPTGDSIASITTPIPAATTISEVNAIIEGSADVGGEVRLRNIKPALVNTAEDTILYPTAGKTLAQVTDAVAEWEATVEGTEVLVSGAIANPRDHPVLMVATINAVASSVAHKYVNLVEGKLRYSLIGGKNDVKLATPTLSKIYNDERQNGVPPRKTADGYHSIEILCTDIGAGTDLPTFSIMAIERDVATTGVDVVIDGNDTENRAVNWMDSYSSSRDIVYKYIGAYNKGDGIDLENLEYVDVSIYVAGLNGFVRFAPSGTPTAGPAWAAKWGEAQNAAEFVQVDVANSAFLNMSVDFYEYPVVHWLDTKPDTGSLTKIGGTVVTGVAWTSMVAGQPDPASQPALFSDPSAAAGTNNIGISFVKTANRYSLHPGTAAYCVFANSDSFTYDLEYITEVGDYIDYTEQATTYFARNRTATLDRSVLPPGTRDVGVLSFEGFSVQLTMKKHMWFTDSLTLSLTTQDVATLTRTTIGGGNQIDGSAGFYWPAGATISPLRDGVTLTKVSSLLSHSRRTLTQSHGATGYTNSDASPVSGPGTYSFLGDEGEKTLEVTINYLRGYYKNNGEIRVFRDSYAIDHSSGLATQEGHTTAGTPIPLTYGGTFTPVYTHHPTNQSYAYRYRLTEVTIDANPPFELDGTRKLFNVIYTPEYGAGDVRGDVFQDFRLADPLTNGDLNLRIVGDSINGNQLSAMRTENDLFGAPYKLISNVNFLPVNIAPTTFNLKLKPPQFRAFSRDYKRYDGAFVDETIVINSALHKYQVTDMVSTFSLENINPYDLRLNEVIHLAASPTSMEILFKHGNTEYTSSNLAPILQNGQYDLAMWQNPNGGAAGRTHRTDDHVRFNVTSRSLPWEVELPISGGKYRVARYRQVAGGDYSLLAQSNGFDLTGTEEGAICRFLDTDANDMGIEIILHAGFWAEVDQAYEGFAWEVNSMLTPLRVLAPKTFELDAIEARVGETHSETLENLLLLNEAIVATRTAAVSVVAETPTAPHNPEEEAYFAGFG